MTNVKTYYLQIMNNNKKSTQITYHSPFLMSAKKVHLLLQKNKKEKKEKVINNEIKDLP